MAKFLLFIGVLAIIYVLIRASNRRDKTPPATHGLEAMAQCAHCGVHFPRAESLREGDGDYCCEEHRRLGDGS